ncbi:MAG: type II secretion system protein, partial [Candidatus Sacchiramonaceae bacterium]|nr:type II secretion system protein [Candidatus Saccharimonadaceae bacterium]
SIPISSLNFHSFTVRRSRALAQALPAHKRKKNRDLQTNAFTIIEVVLVLAIAGLIFLMVFIALPALQRNQRDAQRKNDASLFIDALNRYSANNRGSFPGVGYSTGGRVSESSVPEVYDFALRYLDWPGDSAAAEGKTFIDPSTGAGYRIRYSHHQHSNIESVEFYSMNYSLDRKCLQAGETVPVYKRNVGSVWVKLESGGTYCVELR